MVESYFTTETIHQKSLQLLKTLKPFRERHIFNFKREQSALLILDMQKFFLEKNSHAFIPSAIPIIPRINALQKGFLNIDQPVVFTRHVNNTQNAKQMRQWWEELIKEEDTLSEISSCFELTNSIVLKKSQYDAFYNTTLEDMLLQKGITQLVITGVITHLCCETTARSAFVRGFRLFFPVDGTATYNEDFHQSSLLNLSHGFAIPVLTKEILNKLNGTNNEE